ncbi:MAG: DUF4279 domain-containing protein [Planctomycetota bacterium]
MTGEWYEVSLRLFGDQLDVYEIGPRLGVTPTHTGRKGHHIDDDRRRARYETNIWVWSYTTDNRIPFGNQIQRVLERLEPRAAELKSILSTAGAAGELMLGYSYESGLGGGGDLSSLLVQRVGALGLGISLDLYPPQKIRPWLGDPGAVQALAEKLSACGSVGRFDSPDRQEGPDLARCLSDLEKCFREILEDLLPRVVKREAGQADVELALRGIEEQLRQVHRSIATSRFLGSVRGASPHRGEGERPDDCQLYPPRPPR